MAGQFTDTDRGFAALAKIMSGKGATLRVGFIGAKAKAAKKDGGGLSVAEVAAVHEFGLGRVPRRSMIGGWYFQNRKQILRDLELGLRAVVSGVPEDRVLGVLGVKYQAQIQERIADGIDPPLAASTLKRKGENKATPLIDTGQLRSSVTYEVTRGAK